jgi:hypothetical protein
MESSDVASGDVACDMHRLLGVDAWSVVCRAEVVYPEDRLKTPRPENKRGRPEGGLISQQR